MNSFGCNSMASIKHRGFTLIELIVVIFNIGLASSTLLFRASVRSSNWEFNQTSQRLMSLMEIAREQAISQFTLLGMRAENNQIIFYQYNTQSNNWIPLNE